MHTRHELSKIVGKVVFQVNTGCFRIPNPFRRNSTRQDPNPHNKMPPADSTPDLNTGSFELLYSLQAYNRIPVYEFKSKQTGLTVVIAEVEGPVVNGFFCLATEAFDDDGLPHTLEHLIFLGSEQYPYKGVLDLLANRCLASGTNAWTDIDHTCYTMETAGSEGFLSLMPIYLDHILYPVLAEEGFITEVHHITGEGDDAGVVYCEMQGRENSGESRLHLAMARAIYPGKCGYSSETGGIMKNLRESTNNEKVRNFHKEFYRPENLKVIITGQVKPEEVFRALAPIEEKILSKGDRGSFVRPWQSPVPPIEKPQDLVIKYPSDEENNGMVTVAWRGPSAVKELYLVSACSLLLKYLTDFSASPLQKEFVEIPDPYASKVCFSIYENSETCLYLLFRNVPNDKLHSVKPKLDEVLKKLVDTEDFDMKRMISVLNRHKLESLSTLENSPHNAVAFMIIGHMLYGHTKEDLEQRINPLTDIEKMEQEPKSFWISLIRKYMLDNVMISIEGVPSIEEQQRMSVEEKQRIEAQVATLGEEGLNKKEEDLEKAVEFNERPPPGNMLTCVPIPSIKSIRFHEVIRMSSAQVHKRLDLTNTPVFTYFDHHKTSFVYMFALMDTSNVPFELRYYLPLLLETLLETSLERDGKIIPFEQVVAELQDDTVAASEQMGLQAANSGRFKCGVFSHTASLVLQVQASKYERGIAWLRELMYQTRFTVERLKIIIAKMLNDVAEAKRSGRDVVSYIMKSLRYIPDSNPQVNGILKQQKFLTRLVEKLDTDGAQEVLDEIEKTRQIITNPSNISLFLAANLDYLKSNPVEVINDLIPTERIEPNTNKSLKVTPDWKLLQPDSEGNLSHCVVGMGCLESSYFYQTTASITDYSDPDMPAVLVYLQYLIQAEGPMWRQIRGKGLAYGYSIILKTNEGLLYLVFSRATNVVGAYKEAYDIVTKQTTEKVWDNNLVESAKSSLIYEMVENEETIGSVVNHSLQCYFLGIDYEYNRTLLFLIEQVTIDDLNRVGAKYIAPLFDPTKVKTAIVCDPSKAEEIATGFKKLDIELKVYPSLEESFLNQ